MTIGNAVSDQVARKGGTEQRLVEATLELIAQEGGSLEVNLRGISRRVGCAHTNVYNYFDSYQDLLWAAFRRALRIYGEHLTRGLAADMPASLYLETTISNLAAFPQQSPGLYRFIGSDPIEPGTIPADVMGTVVAMKRWFSSVVEAAADPSVDPASAREAADIMLAYVDGETLNLINGRAVPGEDLGGRIVRNTLRLFELLAGGGAERRGTSSRATGAPPEPAGIFGTEGD
jgi:AcrR family transcriptional regulator